MTPMSISLSRPLHLRRALLPLLLGLYTASSLASQPDVESADQQTQSGSPAPAAAPAPGSDQNTPAAANPSNKPSLVKKDAIQKVVIEGAKQTDLDVRRQSTASKIVIGREELDRDGDSSVGEILKRLPGVTVGGRPGRGGDIRMRGMGSGYTQILVNGERMPRGFSLDTLSPDQVERIEIIRAPVAEFTTQAVAGIINIVLREDYTQTDGQLRLSEGVEQGRSAPSVSITAPGEDGKLIYAINATVFRNSKRDQDHTFNEIDDAPGQSIVDQDFGDTTGVHLSPRVEYRFNPDDKVVVQPFLMFSNTQTSGTSYLDQLNDQPAPYQDANYHTGTNSFVSRVFSNYTHRFDGGAKLELKLGLGKSETNTITDRIQTGSDIGYENLYTNYDIGDFNTSVGGKFTQVLSNGHSISTGLNADWTRRNETEVANDNGAPTFDNSGDNLHAGIRQLAAFVQDEWDINSNWSANAGLRWEGIQTVSALPDGEIVNNSSVWSPLFHLLWRIPDHKDDQLRLSVTHAYRPPVLNDLVTLPVLAQNNSPINPDKVGNPNLKPELSNGVDFGYEHYLSHSGILAANFFYRDITNLMRHEVSLVDGRWVSAPVNLANAQTHGIELEAKFDLVEFFPNAPAISLRSNYSHFWSQVQDIQGPNNRIDQQPSQTANLGADYKMAAIPLTVGGSLNWTPAYIVQSSTTQGNTIGLKRQLDMYALWKFSIRSQLRFSVNNLVNSDYVTSTFSSLGYPEVSTVDAPTYATYTLRWEARF